MIEQTSGNDLRRSRAARPAGALGLLLALALIAGSILPAYAQGPIPTMPHGFTGTVSTITPPQLVPAGTLVEVFVGGAKRAEATVDAEGQYGMLVPGPGGTVTFRVAGVLAHQSITWESGQIDTLDLTIAAMPGDPQYGVTMAVAPAGAGTATELTGAAPYAAGVQIDIKAVPMSGYGFVNWTSAPNVTFADANEAETSFTMPESDVTITANFDDAYTVTMAVDPAGGGTAIDVQGYGEYAEGVQVSIKAQPSSAVYEFVNWSASPTVSLANASAAETTFTMIGGPVTITANFQSSGHKLTLAASPIVGGTVTATPVQELYQAGAVVTIQAVPASGYQFSHWTPGGGVLGNPNVALTTFTMPAADVSVFATFTLSQTGGSVCFIATAAYGSPSAEQIDVLREFRDVVLLQSSLGSGFVALYYRLSPPIAEAIAQNGFLKEVARRTLDPVVWMVEATEDVWRR